MRNEIVRQRGLQIRGTWMVGSDICIGHAEIVRKPGRRASLTVS
jgi:hypothetical protein